MSGERAKGGKKNRKHGHNKRSPAMQRYTNERRWERNRERRIAKDAAFKSLCKQVRNAHIKATNDPKATVSDTCRRIRKLKVTS